MTEIKFRAWNGNKISKPYDLDDLTMAYDCGYYTGLYVDFDVQAEGVVLMQYTGLKDKNGTEIYEGDIITELGEIKVVEWSDDGLGWQFRVTSKIRPANYSSYIEVIGNIYENPELLKGDQ